MENKKMNPQLAQTIFKFIAPQGACMHWAGSSKNKINLQLNKNTIFNIPVMKKKANNLAFFWSFFHTNKCLLDPLHWQHKALH